MRQVAALAVLALAAGAVPAADGEAIYNRACKKCHRIGLEDSPVAGDKAAWAPLLEKGMATLYQSVIEGKGSMEPRANKPDLTDEELRAAVDYMVDLVK
ncbi:MAG: cytochrome c5 family protein [Betaproteobacteria bacterium]|nr:cytochrome c5 family protein [Betaproteobacteria bacterium]